MHCCANLNPKSKGIHVCDPVTRQHTQLTKADTVDVMSA